jgi:hypothetical protein
VCRDRHLAGLDRSLTTSRRSPDLVVVVDRDLRVVAHNRPAELPGDARGPVEDVLRTGEVRTFEWGETGAAGVRTWYAAQALPIEDNGRVTGVLVSSRDITELKQSEQRLRRSEQMLSGHHGARRGRARGAAAQHRARAAGRRAHSSARVGAARPRELQHHGQP